MNNANGWHLHVIYDERRPNQKLKKKRASSSEGIFIIPDLPILFDMKGEALATGTEFRQYVENIV